MEVPLLLVILEKKFSDSARWAAVEARRKKARSVLPFQDKRYGPLDRGLIDIKKDRPLNDPKKVLDIQDTLPGAQFIVPYSKVPFFDRLNKLQGTDPRKVKVEEYTKAREELFTKQPREKIQIKDLVFTQTVVNRDKIKQLANDKDRKDAFVVRYKNKNYVMDGHHNTIARAIRGKKNINARVLTIS